MSSLFTASSEDLKRLNAQEAVYFFRDLLWAEARRINLTSNKIHVSERINVADGGVDAAVEDCDGVIPNGLIKHGLTCYQIKTGDSFKSWQEAEIKKELFGEPKIIKDPNNPKAKGKKEKSVPIEKDRLGDSVRNCLDNDGHYVIVCFGDDLVEKDRLKTIAVTKDFFKQCGYNNSQVEVWGWTEILGFVNTFPALKMKLRGLSEFNFKTHGDWSLDMGETYVFSSGFDSLATTIKEDLLLRDRARHIRVLGEAGSGKTRFVLEVTRDPSLLPLVLYLGADEASPVVNYLRREDSSEVILVVDECDARASDSIWNDLKNLGTRIKLISIYNQIERPDSRIEYIDHPPKLSHEEITKIILSYGFLPESAKRWAYLAGDSPRFAHMIGENLQANPTDVLFAPETFYERIIAGYEDSRDEAVKDRKRVLLYISLFKRFGYREPVDIEAKAISKIVQREFPNIGWVRFQEIVKELRVRKILQGSSTLYISPKALHIHLWTEWWDDYSSGFILDDFLRDLPQTELRDWFYEMFVYAAQSEGASSVIKKLLAEGGLFHDDKFLRSELGANFFFAIAQADPKTALKYLQKKIGCLGKDELLLLTTGRRQIIGALQGIAVWQDLFDGAAKILLQLAEAENEGWSNNATGVFCDLFAFGYGAVATTEASPKQRLLVLKEVLNSEIPERRSIAIKACSVALRSDQWFIRSGVEHQGLRQEPKLWSPQTYGEVWAAYQEVWQMLRERIPHLSNSEQKQVIDVILNRARGIAKINTLSPIAVDTLRELAQNPNAEIRTLTQAINNIIRYDSKEMSSENQKLWIDLHNEFYHNNDFHTSLKYYLSLSEWDEALDILDNFVNTEIFDLNNPRSEQSAIKRGEIILSKLGELANACILDTWLFDAEINWLVTTSELNMYQFGFEIGKRDECFSLLHKILNAQREFSNIECLFLSGYFRAIFEKDIELWEKHLDDLTEDEKMSIRVPEITRRSGQSEKSALRILDLARKGVIDPSQFSVMTITVQGMAENIFLQWMEFLLSICHPYSPSITLNLFYSRYVRVDHLQSLTIQPSEDITFRVLSNYLEPQKNSTITNYGVDSYQWAKIARFYLALYPDQATKVINEIFKNFSEIDTGYNAELQKLLVEIVNKKSKEVWDVVTQYIEPRFNTRAFRITRWLRGGGIPPTTTASMIEAFDPNDIWSWIDNKPEERASYAALFAPNRFFKEDGKVCFAREIIVRYGNLENVGSALVANFSTDGWSGAASIFYQQKRKILLDFKEDENNINVRNWIDSYAETLEKYIENAEINEERMVV
ncbi:MAG: hypothetical protein ACK54J_19030 [Pseudanabaena sp.]